MSIFGKARFGGSTRRKYFKLKDGEQVYRILPPMGDLADSGRWSMFHNIHYGYKTSDKKLKPFLSCEVKNRQNKMVEVPDAAKERLQMLKAKLEEAKKTGNKAALEKLNALVGRDGVYNLDSHHYMNVIDAQGNIGILKIRHKAKLALDVEIKKLEAKGINPLSPETGRYFIFTRTGNALDTTFSVDVLQEEVEVPGHGKLNRDVNHVIDQDTENRCGVFDADGNFNFKEAASLDKLFKKLTAEQVAKVVETSDLMTGVSSYMDQLFAKSDTKEEVIEEEPAEEETPLVEAQPQRVVAPMRKEAAPAAEAAPKASSVKSVTDLSNDDFLAALNNGTL